MAALDPTINFGKVTVSIGYDASATSIILSTGDGAKLPSTFSYNLVWWDSTVYSDPTDDPNVEIVRVTNRSGDTLTVTRAQEGTSTTTKNTTDSTYLMILTPTKKMLDDIDTQHAKLLGRSGGQTINGGTASGDDLTLNSTTNGTKGDIVLGAGVTTIDEVNSIVTHIADVKINENNAPTAKDTIATGVTGSDSIVVRDGYAYLCGFSNDTFAIFDVGDPDAIVAKDTTTDGIDGPVAIAVAGKYVYVLSQATPKLSIFDITDAENIVTIGSITTGLTSCFDVKVVGKFAYVVDNNNLLLIFDCSDPANIVARDTISTGLNIPQGLVVNNRYAYVPNITGKTIAIFDITDPDNITVEDTIDVSAEAPRQVFLSGKYLYVSGNTKIAIYDVSDVTAIVAKDSLTTNFSNGFDLYVAGRYLAAASFGNNTVIIYDISDVDNIVSKSSITSGISQPVGLYIDGRYLYVSNFGTEVLSIFQFNHFDIPFGVAGSLEINTLSVLDRLSVNGSTTDLNSGLNVTNSALFNDDLSVVDNLYSGTLLRSVESGITASTTQTQGQQPLTKDVNEIDVVAFVNDTVTMPTAVTGMEIMIINNGANTLRIFPASSDNLGAGVNTAVTLASGSNVTYVAYNATNWETK